MKNLFLCLTLVMTSSSSFPFDSNNSDYSVTGDRILTSSLNSKDVTNQVKERKELAKTNYKRYLYDVSGNRIIKKDNEITLTRMIVTESITNIDPPIKDPDWSILITRIFGIG